MNSKVKGTLIFIVIMLGLLLFVMFQFGRNEENQRHNKIGEVLVSEAVDSMNRLYDMDNYVCNTFFGGEMEDTLNSGMIRELLEHIQISEEYADKIREKAKGAISRSVWGEILLILGQATGLSDVCSEDTISVYSINQETGELISDTGIYNCKSMREDIIDKKISIICRENVILFVVYAKESADFHNVLITGTEGDLVTVQISGAERQFMVRGLKETEQPDLKNVLADIILEQGNVQELRLKREKISAKVLAFSKEFIELEGFGQLPVSQSFRVFKGENFGQGSLSDVRVGDSNIHFIAADKEICAAIVHSEEMPPANIRVLINSSGYSDMFHDIISITCQKDFNLIYNEISAGGNEDELQLGKEVVHSYKAGEVLTIDAKNEILKFSRIRIVSTDDNAGLEVLSVSRNKQNPEYRGSLEISAYEGRLILINEVSVERYLYSVVPSEMPSSYGVEALKVQAVCARSYAYSHMNGGRLAKYGAHVDDSTDYQVYNNTAETENSISAVDATKGMIMSYNGEIVNAYFYATSCGCTTNGSVWDDREIPYIQAKYLNPEQEMPDLMNNEIFTEFIKQKPESFDMDSVWYRWNVTLSTETISNSINHCLYSLYKGNRNQVLTENSSGEFESVPVSSVGTVTDISVTKRGPGGIVEEMVITGSEAKVKIVKQGNIRKLFNPYGNDIVRNDGSTINSFTSLPSAFFAISKGADGNSYEIHGGGYGHGAGMSQTAVRKMIDLGMNYTDILEFFYSGIEIISYSCVSESTYMPS